MKKFLLLLLGGLALSIPCAAENYLHVKTGNGWEVLDLDLVDRLTFSETSMTATDEEGKTVAAFDRTDLDRMYVDETTGVATIKVADTAAAFRYDAATRTATMLADGTFELIAADGKILVSIPAKAGETINLSDIKPGVVIMKAGKTSTKAILK